MTEGQQLGLLYCAVVVGYLGAKFVHSNRWVREELPVLLFRQRLKVL